MAKVVKPNFTGVIIDVKAGFIPPEGFIKKAMEENKSFVTFAALSAAGGLGTSHDEEGELTMPSLPEFMQFLEQSKDDRRVLYMADYPNVYKHEDVQPFNLCSNVDGETLMSIFVEGDFPTHAIDAKNEGRSEEGLFFDNVLGPYLEERLLELNNDFEKLVQSLQSNTFRNLIAPYIGHRGNILLLPSVGESKLITTNQVGGEWDWGMSTHNYGWTDKVEAVADATPKATFSFGRKKATSTATPEAKPEVKPSPAQSVPHVPAPAADPNKTDPQTAYFQQPGEYKTPPHHLKGNKLQGWYHQMLGIPVQLKLDFEWRKQPRVFIPNNKNIAPRVEQLKELSQLANAQVHTKNVAAEADNMIMSADEVTSVMDFCMKIMPDDKSSIISPLEMQKAEEKLVTFEEAVGVSLDDVHNFPIGALFALAREKPKAAALLLIGYRRRSIIAKNLMGDQTLGDMVNTEAVNDKPAGKFSFGRKKAA